MKARLLILIVILGIVGVYFVVAKDGQDEPKVVIVDDDDPNAELITSLGETSKPLAEYDFQGEVPTIPAEFNIDVEVDTSKGRNKLILYVTEAHGYYADQFRIEFFKKAYPDNRFDHFEAEKYLRANDTLVIETFPVPAELVNIGGDVGKTGDWGAEIVHAGRVFLEDPPNLPER